MPNALVFKNQLLAATKDVRGAIDLCEETLKLLRADLDKGGGQEVEITTQTSAWGSGGALKGLRTQEATRGVKAACTENGWPAAWSQTLKESKHADKFGVFPPAAGKFRETHPLRVPLPSGTKPKGRQHLKVVIRKRPPSEGEEDCVECVEEQVQVREGKVKV
eukprot:CAMPEP_0171817824 /NCGR_PEP_ID=MMETSP0992-20121227/1309_1 /TAXON_ID=483369 /ORGANISM="non described non described, Strain CCMP2098" /LENGTH=162 /DNA_ID=CAMNT_0012431913 /DNA_START=72 /DNA_END=556 /DNA_ORIENTATION=+